MIIDIHETIDRINDFIRLLEECNERKAILNSRLSAVEKEREDSLHRIELECCNYYELAREGEALKEILIRRREVKDAITQNQVLSTFFAANIDKLRNLAESLNKNIVNMERRRYVSRTDGRIIKEKAPLNIEGVQHIGDIIAKKEKG